jgi:hypothetical protein
MAPKKIDIGKILKAAVAARIRVKVENWFYPPRIVEEPGGKPKVVSFCISYFFCISNYLYFQF